MAVDEFGREIPGRGGGGGGGSGSGAGGTGSSLLDGPLSSGRSSGSGEYRSPQSQPQNQPQNHHHYYRSSGSGGDHRRSDETNARPLRNSQSSHTAAAVGMDSLPLPPRNGSGSGSHVSHTTHCTTGSTIAGRPKSAAPPLHHHHHPHYHQQQQQQQHHPHHQQHQPSNLAGFPAAKRHHPSYQYVDEPLLCHFLWKEEHKLELQQQQSLNPTTPRDEIQPPPLPKPADDDDDAAVETRRHEQPSTSTLIHAVDDDSNTNTTTAAIDTATATSTPADADTTASCVAYEHYKKSYCLNYIRAFFNQHLDDSWFRFRYSPAVKLAFQHQHRTVIGHVEAHAMATLARDHALEWVAAVRLGGGGGGGKPGGLSTTTPTVDSTEPPHGCTATPTGHLYTFQHALSVLAVPATATQETSSSSSSSSSVSLKAALHITEIPPHVTDAQVCAALTGHVTSSSATAASSKKTSQRKSSDLVTLIPTCTMTTVTSRRALQRDVIAIGAIATIQEILRNLANLHHKRRSGASGSGGSTSEVLDYMQPLPRKDGVLPRKGEVSSNLELLQTAFNLEVECSDPYGRVEYDADGRGAAPADGLAVPLRKAVVLVAALTPHQATTLTTTHHQQQRPNSISGGGGGVMNKCVTVTLSAALSSSHRWATDTASALQLAAALDKQQLVPMGSRLQDILASLPSLSPSDDAPVEPNNDLFGPRPTDRLDVAVAYLRRVHCLSFYHGCAQAESVADVVTGKSPVSTIYLRLQNADDILSQAATPPARPLPPLVKVEPDSAVDANETDEMIKENNTILPDKQDDGPKDMLVQRLDDAIDRALRAYCDVPTDEGYDDICRIATQQDLEHAAASINDAESNVQQKWLSDHAIMDDDGRARCSFVFCHKLFKDSTFLYQHLLKKHAEYLHAEQAKCHDAVMMAEWDRGTQPRPVPDILVDCGVRFGMVAATITGGPEPNCVDPEPELWRREEERRQREAEMKARRAEIRNAAATAQHQEQQHAPLQPRAPRATFVDVDDMKEEKVELSFDAVPMPDTSVTALLKKKKKRKLL